MPSAISFTKDNRRMAISGQFGMTVYSGLTEDNIQVEQDDLGYTYAHTLSKDGRYLITGATGYNVMSAIFEDKSMSKLKSE